MSTLLQNSTKVTECLLSFCVSVSVQNGSPPLTVMLLVGPGNVLTILSYHKNRPPPFSYVP